MTKIYTSRTNFLFVIMMLMLIFQDWISQKVSFWKYFDEGLAVCLFFVVVVDRIYRRNYKYTQFDLYAGVSILIYWFSTTMSSLFFGFQPLTIALKASFLGMKWFIVFWSTKYICSRLEEATWKSTSRIVHELTIIFGIVENWYWIHNIKHVFDRYKYYNALTPMYLCAVNVMLLAFLFIEWRGKKLDSLSLGLLLENLIFSTKAKGYGTALLTILLVVWIIKMKRQIKLHHIVIMGIACVCLVWEKIYFYYIYASTPDHDYARYRLTATGFQILKDYFPFGTGWGTWGSYYSSVNYSPVYYLYGIDQHRELGVRTRMYIMDSYLASMMGESGFLGLLMIMIFMLSLFTVVNKLYKVDNRVYAAGLLCLFYLCITFVEETGFANPALIGIALVMGRIVSIWEKSCMHQYKAVL